MAYAVGGILATIYLLVGLLLTLTAVPTPLLVLGAVLFLPVSF